jgi:glycosyltransferase EpsF
MSDPIRVCEFVGNMNGGGVEAVVMNYYRHVDRSRVQFDFVVTESSTIVPRKEMESLGARVFTVPAYTNLPAFQRASYELFRAHPEWKIIHAHMNALNVFPLKEADRAGIPVRISHSHSTAGKGETMKNAAKAILKTQANRYPTDRFACSGFAGEWLFGKDVPFEVVYNAINLQRFFFSAASRAKARDGLGLVGNQFVIGHVGRFTPQKNHRFLLEAFSRAAAKRDDLVLLCAGSGEAEALAESWVAERGLTGKVRFLGQRDDVNELYQAFDVFAMPSLYEGLGLVGVEAQAVGLPCLLSDRITREVDVTGTCDFLPIDDPDVWADAMCAVEPRTDAERAGIDRADFTNYNIVRQGQCLTDKYLDLYEGAERR